MLFQKILFWFFNSKVKNRVASLIEQQKNLFGKKHGTNNRRRKWSKRAEKKKVLEGCGMKWSSFFGWKCAEGDFGVKMVGWLA